MTMRTLSIALATCLLATGASAQTPLSGARQLTFEGARAGEGYFSANGACPCVQAAATVDQSGLIATPIMPGAGAHPEQRAGPT
jgi:hypothetical protein